tara:strand:- start:82 stop:372 length:291 start_codon:yes stop_codon:yes gene_type:complete
MAGSIGLGLNLGAGPSGGGAPGYLAASFTGGTGACFFELHGASGELKPFEPGAIVDFNTVWDLDGTDYTPQETPVTDCNWDVSGSPGSYELTPKDV